MVNKLLLFSGNDIPYAAARLTLHQPTIKEIAYLGEEAFFKGCELLTISKETLTQQDKQRLNDYTNFDIVMSILLGRDTSKVYARSVLSLLFFDYNIEYEQRRIKFTHHDNEQNNGYLDVSTFDGFKDILVQMFCMETKKKQEYKPQGELAQKIADKIRKGRATVNKAKGRNEKDVHVLAQYISILSVGLSKDRNELMEYTIPQLFDEYKRYEMKLQYDIYVQQKMAGAKNVKDVDFWMKDIY